MHAILTVEAVGLAVPPFLLPSVVNGLAEVSKIAGQPCPFTEGKAVRDTHFVFLGLSQVEGKPFTLLKLEELCTEQRFSLISDMSKVQVQGSLALQTTEQCLYLVPAMYPFGEMEYENQRRCLPPDYVVSHVVEAVNAQMYYRNHAGSFFGGSSAYGRCSDLDLGGYRYMVGCGQSDGLAIALDHNNIPGYGLGLSVHRKIAIA